MSEEAYLDCAASAPLRPEALDAMLPYLTEHHGNPSGSHAVARRARRGLEEARDLVAGLTGATPHGVVFTSGGTEADNLAIHGFVADGVAVCAATEHHAVLDPVVAHGGRVVGVDSDGLLDVDHLAAELRAPGEVTVVSVMAVNNETGVVQNLGDVAEVVRRHAPAAVLHTDAVQAAHWLDLREVFSHVDAMSLAGHKFGGPKGSGVLVLGDAASPAAQILGGGQEHERRSGTQNVAAAVGFAAALTTTDERRVEENARIAGFRERIESTLTATPQVEATIAAGLGVPGICHLTMEGVESEAVLVALERAGIMAAAASSCASGALQPSHVLTAMGRTRAQAAGALRLSMAYSTTAREVELVVSTVPSIVAGFTRGVVHR